MEIRRGRHSLPSSPDPSDAVSSGFLRLRPPLGRVLQILGCRLPRIHQFPGTLQLPGALRPIPGTPRPEDCLSQRKVPRAHRLLPKNYEPVIMSYEKMKASGLNLEIFSGGGTGTYDIMTAVKGFTDVQVGSYIFMDCQYIEIGGAKNEKVFDDFAPSLTIMTTVINNNYPGRLITDSGTKALTLNKPNAMVIGEPTFEYVAGSDEYGTITFTSSNKTYKVGDKLEVIIPHCDPVVNLYDFIYGIRKDKVESILPILARGKSQ